MTEEDDYYPTWRSALQDNGGYANLWCLIKYLAWHGSYLVFIILGAAFTAIVVPLVLGYRILVVSGRKLAEFLNRVLDRIIQSLPKEKAERVENFFESSIETASTKPVTRRIVSYCPVRMNIQPHWFKNLSDVGDMIIEKVRLPKTVYVCDNCGSTWRHKNDGEYCRICNDGTYVETTDKKATEVHPDADP